MLRLALPAGSRRRKSSRSGCSAKAITAPVARLGATLLSRHPLFWLAREAPLWNNSLQATRRCVAPIYAGWAGRLCWNVACRVGPRIDRPSLRGSRQLIGCRATFHAAQDSRENSMATGGVVADLPVRGVGGRLFEPLRRYGPSRFGGAGRRSPTYEPSRGRRSADGQLAAHVSRSRQLLCDQPRDRGGQGGGANRVARRGRRTRTRWISVQRCGKATCWPGSRRKSSSCGSSRLSRNWSKSARSWAWTRRGRVELRSLEGAVGRPGEGGSGTRLGTIGIAPRLWSAKRRSPLKKSSSAITGGRGRRALKSALWRGRVDCAAWGASALELGLARQALKDAEIRAPFAGVVEQRYVVPGSYVQVGDPVVALVKVNPWRFRASVPEREAAAVRLGQRVSIHIEGEPRPLEAVIARISPSVEASNRSLTVEAAEQAASEPPGQAGPGGPEPQLRRGLFAEADIHVDPDARTLAVPRRPCAEFAGVEKVWRVSGGEAAEQPVGWDGRTTSSLKSLAGSRTATLLSWRIFRNKQARSK